MAQYFGNLHTFRDDPSRLIVIIVFSAAAMFLVVKGWVNTSLFLLFFICCWQILNEPRNFFINRSSQFWVMVFCMLTPFMAELIAQIGRGQFTLSSLDGPSRAILATGFFIWLSKKDCLAVVHALSAGSAVGIILVSLYLQIFPEYFWEHRAATHFVDPITLPCFTVALLGIFVFIGFPGSTERFNALAKSVLTLMTLYVAIESYSRSAWVAGLVLAEVYVLYSCRRSIKRQILAHACLVILVLILFQFSEVLRDRTLEALGGVIEFFSSGRGQATSSVQRLIMILIDFELISHSPLFGMPDGVMPSYEYLKSVIPAIDQEIYKIKALAGSHSEFSAQLVRKGVLMGTWTIWALFIYPIYIIIRELKSRTLSEPDLRVALLGLVVSVMVSGLAIQVLNLKMTISFYTLCLAILFASICRHRELVKRD